MPVPEDNPITAEKIDVGRRLFFDCRLWRDGSISCASCHTPERALTDARARAVGVFGRTGRAQCAALLCKG
jgi:cytochrome c peroxidase